MTEREILRRIKDQFPQADPDHEHYDTGINGGDAVEFICEIIPEIIKCLNTPPPKVMIGLSGGLIQDITSDRPAEVVPSTFIIVDYDTSDSDEEEDLHQLQALDGTREAVYARIETVEATGVNLDQLAREILPGTFCKFMNLYSGDTCVCSIGIATEKEGENIADRVFSQTDVVDGWTISDRPRGVVKIEEELDFSTSPA